MGRFLFVAWFACCAAAAQASSTAWLNPLPGGEPRVLAAAPDPEHFTFAVAGDNRSTGRGVPEPPTAREVFSELSLIRPAFCLWTGDTIYGSEESLGEAQAEYSAFLSELAPARIPIFNAPGNHEIYDRPDREVLYRRMMGRLYGSFDYGRSHFIAMDTEEAGRPVGLGAQQRRWLEADLAANQGAEHIFVFSHHPLFPTIAKAGFADNAERDDLHRLFVRSHVSMVFSGHQHLFAKSVHDGVTYVVTGGAGAPNEGDPAAGGMQHYLLVYVNGRDLQLKLLEPWRLFARVGPVETDGSCTAQIDNYHDTDLPVTIDFPTDRLAGHAQAVAALSYKTWKQPVATTIVPATGPGTISVRVTVPRARSVVINLRAAPAPRAPATP